MEEVNLDSGYDNTRQIDIIDWAIVADVKQYRNEWFDGWHFPPQVAKQGRVELVLPGELQSAIFLLINKYLNHKDTELLENTDFTD